MAHEAPDSPFPLDTLTQEAYLLVKERLRAYGLGEIQLDYPDLTHDLTSIIIALGKQIQIPIISNKRGRLEQVGWDHGYMLIVACESAPESRIGPTAEKISLLVGSKLDKLSMVFYDEQEVRGGFREARRLPSPVGRRSIFFPLGTDLLKPAILADFDTQERVPFSQFMPLVEYRDQIEHLMREAARSVAAFMEEKDESEAPLPEVFLRE